MTDKIALKKSLNVLNCVSYLISMIIGSGIFIVPNVILRDAGSVGSALLTWVLGGIFYAVFGALSYAELGCLIPKTGGEYAYFRTAFGDIFGFVYVWAFTFIYFPAMASVAALTFSDYALKIFFPTCSEPENVRLILATCSILIIGIINCGEVKVGQLFGYVFNVGKITGLVMIIAFGVYGLYLGRVESFQSPFENSNYDVSKLVLAFNSGAFSYTGWNSLNNLVGEMKNPNKTFPLSIFVGLIIVIFFYLSVNVAYLTFLSPLEMVASNAVAFTFVEKLIGSYSWIMSVFVCLSALGFINGTIIASSRVVYAAAGNGHMPVVFSLLNVKYDSPILAVAIATIFPLIYVHLKNMEVLLNIGMLLGFLVNISCIIALFYLRRKEPNKPRPFKVNLFFPTVFLLVAIIVTCTITLMYQFEALMCFVFLLLLIPLYHLSKMNKPPALEKTINKYTVWFQKLCVSVPGEKDE